MARLEIRPFSDEFLDAAGELLAARHCAHRAVEPLLPPRFEEAAAAAELVTELAATDGASGAVALRGGRVVGYLLGVRRSEEIWGASVWVDLAGHAVEVPEDLRDLYAAAARVWVDEDERPRHHARVPATDPALLDARIVDAASAALDVVDPWSAAAIETALKQLCNDLGEKPRTVYLPIRVAVTGSRVSPGLYESLELLGKETSLTRLHAGAEAAQ